MDVQMLTSYFIQYGAVFIYLIVLLEYMNFPGFPAGVIMPLAGIWAAKAVRSLNPKLHERLKEQALLTAERYRSLSLAMYEESIYAQCIHEKQKKMWNSHGKEELLVNE